MLKKGLFEEVFLVNIKGKDGNIRGYGITGENGASINKKDILKLKIYPSEIMNIDLSKTKSNLKICLLWTEDEKVSFIGKKIRKSKLSYLSFFEGKVIYFKPSCTTDKDLAKVMVFSLKIKINKSLSITDTKEINNFLFKEEILC